MATTEKVTVTISVTVGLDDLTVKAIADAAKKVGAPDDARITTGGAPVNAQGGTNHPFGVTFTYTQEK